MERSSSSEIFYDDPPAEITSEDVLKFTSFLQDLETAKQQELDEIYQDTDRAVANDFVSNLLTDVTDDIEKSRQLYSRARNSVDIQELREIHQETTETLAKHAHFEEGANQLEVMNVKRQQEENDEFSDMSRKELEELIRSLRMELMIKNQDCADKEFELEQGRYMIQQLQNELSSVSPNNLKVKKDNTDAKYILNKSLRLKNKTSKSSLIPTTVKSEEPDFWRVSEEKPENELTKFEDIAAAKDLWIINAEKLPINSYAESKQSSFIKSPGVKTNPLTKQPLAALTRNEKLNSRLRHPPTLKHRSIEGSKTVNRSVPKLINKSAVVK